MSDRSRTPADIWMLDGDRRQEMRDELATEAPLEIRVRTDGGCRTVAVTMRTPGHEAELAAGFLFCEGVVSGAREIVAAVAPRTPGGAAVPDVVEVRLAAGLEPDLAPLERHFFATSACGVCGRTSLAGGAERRPALEPGRPRLRPADLYRLPERLHRAQGTFRATGGLHAAALFGAGGELLAVREDIGRHNALDKLIGWALGAGRVPLAGQVVLVSGRASWEVVQKCLAAGAPVLAAVSAPSSLAVSLARDAGLTLVGFLRERRLNVYAGEERIAGG